MSATRIPSPTELAALIDEALTLRASIAEKSARLKEVESLIEAAALEGPHQPLKEADREGRQFLARSSSGRVLPVVFTSDSLIKSFQDKSDKHRELETLAGSTANLLRFFKKPTKWETLHDDGHKFRASARELLGELASIPFIAACRAVDKAGIPKSSTRFAYDQVEG